MNEIVLKYCYGCNQDKPLDDFSNCRATKDGKQVYCKMCRKIYSQSKVGREAQKRARKTKAGRKSQQKYRQSKLGKENLSRSRIKRQDNGKAALYRKNKISSNKNYKILESLRSRLWYALNDKSIKSAHTLELLGCTIDFLKAHLESQFTEGMSWGNYGKKGWHIDHKKACSKFDLSDPEQQKLCFHFSNLQPLWWIDNLKKGKK